MIDLSAFSQRKLFIVTFVLLALASLVLWLSQQVTAEGPSRIAVRVPAAQAEAVVDVDAVHRFDYGGFVWLELEPAGFQQLQSRNISYQRYDVFSLELGGQVIDTLDGEVALPAGWRSPDSNDPDLHLIQLAGPTKTEWLDQLQADGLQVVQYIHPFTYVVWGQSSIVEASQGAEFVRWTIPFAPAFRVLPQWRDLNSQPVDVDILLYRGADTAAILGHIDALSQANRGGGILNDTWQIAGFTVAGDQLQTIAQIPGVYSIQLTPSDGGQRGELTNQINVNNVDGTNLAFPGYQTWLANVGLSGNGVIMANVDGGIAHTHPDLINRMLGCTGQTCGGNATDSHGTHTAGVMAADGASGVVDSNGFLRGLGMAPGANLIEQVYSPYFTWPNGMLLLMEDSYANNAVLSGNSWGPSGSPQGYDNDTLQVDIGVRDADPNSSGNQQFSYILSFMNGGGGTSTQGTPDEAKNIFTIGSTKAQFNNGNQILDINDISANSAHGPALDGRTIPHMVAPGCNVDSTVPGGYGVSGWCGTSMASPHVSGAVGLFFEYYRNLFTVDPSPALVKAAFLPVAHDLAGNEDADGGTLGHPFDSKQGWGRMDTAAVLSPTLPVVYYDAPVLLDNTGEEWSQTLLPIDPAQPMRLMLVWTDAPGHGLGGSTPAWNNDLDLVIEYNGQTYYGNNFGTDGNSVAGGSADDRNNTEGVFFGTVNGALTVRVMAANINSDGVPGQGDGTDQDFALVCYNCTNDPNAPLVTVDKSASETMITAGDSFTYTLTHNLTLSGSHIVTDTLRDDLPTEVTVLVNTIMLNGTPAPQLYDAVNHRIVADLTTNFTDNHSVVIEFEVISDETLGMGAMIDNSFTVSTEVDGNGPYGPYTGSVTVQVVAIPTQNMWLPFMAR